MTVLERYRTDFQRMGSGLPGQFPWVKDLRTKGLDGFVKAGFPTRRNEDWKYTDVRGIEQRSFAPARMEPALDLDALAPYLLADAERLVFVDGCFAAHLSTPGTAGLTNMAAALEAGTEALQGYFGRYAIADGPGFVGLNTAFMADGAYLHLGRGLIVERPIHLLYVSTGAADIVAHVRNLIVAEEGSRAVVVESYVALGDRAYWTNAVTEVVVGRNAAVEHYKLEQESEQSYHTASIYVQQERDSRYTSHFVATGGLIARNELQVRLDAEGAECELNGLYLTRGQQQIDNHTRIEHVKPHCTSRELYKGVLDGQSRGVFSGRVVVHKNAQATDARQTNNNLLLSESAEADSRPQLEIYADDVKCSHGSTVGTLDADALFYLRSRAIDEAQARSLLVYAFAGDVLDRMQLKAVRARVEGQLAARLLGEQVEDAR